MDVKTLRHIEIKNDDRGEVEAIFATFNVIDADGDVTLPGAFDDNGEVPISAYGHSSWDHAMPVGKARIRSTDREAILSGQFFMDTTAGRDTFTTVKHLGKIGQWSYGYDPVEFSFGQMNGQKVRFLPKQKVFEVSPVLRGVGVNTRTLSAKSAQPSTESGRKMSGTSAMRPHETDVVNQSWDRDAVVVAISEGATIADLRSMTAWVDPTGDLETKDAYRFWHHGGPGGQANVRACVVGIAVLNGARGVDVASAPWGEDRDGIYAHLAGHIRDADREPPELRAAGGSIKDAGGGDLLSQIVTSLVGPREAIAAVGRLVAPTDGRPRKLSNVKAEYLSWLDEDLMALHRQLRSYLDSPDDEAVREYLRFVQHSI